MTHPAQHQLDAATGVEAVVVGAVSPDAPVTGGPLGQEVDAR